jgi:alpha-tubulin suppressor-like RCC1 family protein
VNACGQLGDGTFNNKHSPVQVGGAPNWRQVACGCFFTVAVKTDGTLWAWGHNMLGELGDGTTISRTLPVPVGSATNWKQIACGGYHSLAVQTDGTLWAWGWNYYGQLGDGTTAISKTSPAQVGSLNTWQQVACGGAHTVAVRTDHTLWAWGWNIVGQLGDGTTITRTSPVPVGSATNWQQVACGDFYTVAVQTDHTLWDWGYNYYGQLGDGTTVDKWSPVQIAGTTWAQVAGGGDPAGGGGSHTLAVKTDGTLWAWGSNISGQLGDGTAVQRYSPVQVP